MKWVKRLGSLPFAISLLVLLALTLVVSTLLESAYGTPFAQKAFYTALWFDAVLGLIALNLACAALSRWPFKKRHTGFVVTHVGIIALLFGAFLSRAAGSEGQIQLFEGESEGRLTTEGYALIAKNPAGESRIELGRKNRLPARGVLPGGEGIFQILQVRENAFRETGWVEGPEGEPMNRAVVAELSSEATGLRQHVELSENGEKEAQIGPARFTLKTPGEKRAATLKIRRKDGLSFEIDPTQAVPPPVSLGKDLSIVKMRYLGSAKVENGVLVNAPDEIRFNPAVEFTVADAEGRTEDHTKLFLFPQFPSLKGGPAKDAFGLEVGLEAELPEGAEETAGASFTFTAPEKSGGPWRYRVASSKSAPAEGVLRPGEPVATGWMDMKLTAKSLFERARPSTGVSFDKNNPEARVAVEFEAGGVRQWLLAGERATLSGKTAFALVPNSRPLPFVLKLEDFRKKDYPGTTNAASFESDVTLTDPEKSVTMRRTISMNKPLDYAGWRIFQSSYMQDPDHGEGSVFTVAKNPGIPFIYGGSLVILAGVILLFYLHPFFTGKAS